MEKDCKVIQIITPKKFILNGLWFGADSPKRVIIYIHGLASTAFPNLILNGPEIDRETAVITFGNRGHDKITRIKRIDKRRRSGYSSIDAGEAHEVFEECVDDIQGVVDFATSKKVKEIYLMGHSTGCQKSIFYASRRGKQKQIKGIILLAPVSDYAYAIKIDKDGLLEKTVKYAQKMIKEGREHDLLPLDLSEDLLDAQRFLSLYTKDSNEEIFSYAVTNRKPKTLKSVKIPILAIFADKDEYKDRPTKKIVKWFTKNVSKKVLTAEVIKNASHGFVGSEKEVMSSVRNFIQKTI